MPDVNIDAGLLDAVRGARAVLFLGAGASRGALDTAGKKIPDGKELGAMLIAEFLDPSYEDLDFKGAYDLSCSVRSVREVQTLVHKIIEPFQPPTDHLLIPQFAWAGIATTNYDLLIERSYEKCPDRVQDIEPCTKDADGASERLSLGKILYLKLHGCVTRYQDINPPMVASTEQIINHADGRGGQFSLFMEWAASRTLIFVGYSMADANLRALVEAMRKEGDNRPRHFIVRPGIREAERGYWQERRIWPIDMDFSAFLRTLDQKIGRGTRGIATLAKVEDSISFTRFIAVKEGVVSDALLRYLSSQCEHVSIDTVPGTGNARRFYNGFEQGWYPIEENLDVRRRIARTIYEEKIVPSGSINAPQFSVLAGHAGAGKSIIIRRLAWDAAKDGKLVFYIPRGGNIDLARIEEIVSLTKETIFFFIDDITDCHQEMESLIRDGRRCKWPIAVVGGVRANEWNTQCDDLEPLVDQEYEIGYLSETEIDDLLGLLEKHDCLGELGKLERADRSRELKDVHGRQLLVALHEATKNDRFSNIVRNEYYRISPEEAKLLYLDICSLHRFGAPVRAGIIARLHGIDYDVFKDKFYAPLEDVVDIRIDRKTGDYAYHARHPIVAAMVYEQAIRTVEEKFENALRLIKKLNVTYSYDQDVLFHLTRATTLVDLFPDRVKGSAIYDIAIEIAGKTAHLLHQRGIYEMKLAGDDGALSRAERYLTEAVELAPYNRTMAHSLAELSFTRSKLASKSGERASWRHKAVEQCNELVGRSITSHVFHTIAKCHVATIRDLMEREEAPDDQLHDEVLSQAMKGAEAILRSGLQKFPGDSHLLAEEAELGKLFQDVERSLKALTKAFNSSPQSVLIARRLAMVLRVKGDLPAETEMLKRALAANPGNRDLNFDYAQAILKSAPDAYTTGADIVLYHLARSYTPGDKNYQAQFWHGRQLFLMGRGVDARKIFDKLKEASVPYSLRSKPQGIVIATTGLPERFSGVIAMRRHGYGFAKLDKDGNTAFFAVNSEDTILNERAQVTFQLGFSFQGAMAVDIQPA